MKIGRLMVVDRKIRKTQIIITEEIKVVKVEVIIIMEIRRSLQK